MPEALIVGGGIAGLATAVGLARTGWSVRVLDRERSWDDAGAAISLAVNGLRALDALGVGDQVRAVGHGQVAGGIRRPDGRRLGRLPHATDRGDQVVLGVVRRDLHRTLLEALPEASVHVRAPVRSIDPAGRVWLHDGSTMDADLVVGADGASSTARASVAPDTPKLVDAGYTVVRAVVPDPGGVSDDFSLTWGPGVEFGHLRLPGRRLEWHAQLRTADPTATGSPGFEEVERRVGGWHHPVPALLAASDPDRVLTHTIRVLAQPLPALVYGKVVLVGDAAHPMVPNLGQGASLGLEDAVELAAALRPAVQHRAPPAGALADYDTRRRSRVHAVTRATTRAARTSLLTRPAAIALRNTALILAPPRVAARAGLAHLAWTPPTLPPQEPGR